MTLSSQGLPLTGNSKLWSRAVSIGEEVIWLHTYGSRCVDRSSGRLEEFPRLPLGVCPKVTVPIPSTSDRMPDHIDYDEETEKLIIGEGAIAPVSRAVWEYSVGGMNIIRQWFEYRRRRRGRQIRSSDLDDIRPTEWMHRFTDDLLNLIHVLGRCVLLEPTQEELLDEICTGPLVTVSELERVGVLPVSPEARKLPRPRQGDALPDL